MPGFILRHLMHRIMDGVQIQLLSALGQRHLALGGATLGLHTHLQVLLGAVGHNLAQQLRKLGRMLRLLIGGLFPVQADLRIALAVRHARHGQVHTNLGALAGKVGAQPLQDLLIHAGGHAHHMLSRPAALGLLLSELIRTSPADGADLRRFLAGIHITTHAANELFHTVLPPLIKFNFLDQLFFHWPWPAHRPGKDRRSGYPAAAR